MIISIENIYQMDYESIDERGYVGTCASPSQQLIKTIIPERYADEIKSLCDYAGVKRLIPGMVIRMSLQEISTIIPKKRVRIESYRQLMKFLNDELSVTLKLTSRKTK